MRDRGDGGDARRSARRRGVEGARHPLGCPDGFRVHDCGMVKLLRRRGGLVGRVGRPLPVSSCSLDQPGADPLPARRAPGARVRGSLVVLVMVLFVATFALVPGQSPTALGLEVSLVAITAWGITTRIQYKAPKNLRGPAELDDHARLRLAARPRSDDRRRREPSSSARGRPRLGRQVSSAIDRRFWRRSSMPGCCSSKSCAETTRTPTPRDDSRRHVTKTPNHPILAAKTTRSRERSRRRTAADALISP